MEVIIIINCFNQCILEPATLKRMRKTKQNRYNVPLKEEAVSICFAAAKVGALQGIMKVRNYSLSRARVDRL